MNRLFHWLFCDYGKWGDCQIKTLDIETGQRFERSGQMKICKLCGKKKSRVVRP